jgi:PAS domain S-box-containing protein
MVGHFPEGSQASARILANTWSNTLLGPIDNWPASLQIPLGVALNCSIPTILWHGPEFITFFNDAALPIFGEQRFDALGGPGEEALGSHWQDIGPIVRRVATSGKSASISRLLLPIDGETPQRCFTLSFSPIRDTTGALTGVQGLAIEITETGKRELAAPESNAACRASLQRLSSDQRLSAFLEHSTVIGFLKDADGRYEYLSPTFEKRYNIRQEDWLGKSDFEVWPEAIAKAFTEADRAALARGGNCEIVESAPDPNGVEAWWLTNKFVFSDAMGQTHVGGLSVDITARKLTEEALIASEQKRKIGASLAGLALAEVDYKTDAIHLSNEAARLFGLGEEEMTLPRATVHATFHPDDRATVMERIRAALEPTGTGWVDMDVCILLAEGKKRWLRTRTQIFFEGEGVARQPLRAMLAMFDITTEKRADEALRESELRFRAISEMNPDAIVVSVEGRYVYANPAAVELLEARDANEILSLTPFDVVAPQFYDLLRERLKSAVEENHADPLRDYQWVKRTGELVDVEVATGPIIWLGKRGVQAVARNITERKLAEAALRDVDRRKDMFLATLAHELRNPLAPIANGVDLLLKTESSNDTFQRRYDLLRIMKRQVGHLVRLVDDLLEISRINHGKIEIRKALINCAVVIRNAIETCQPILLERGHQITVDLPTEPIMIFGDPVRLTQVISNLISNAANYTKQGGQISVSLGRADGNAAISIRDNGIGIPTDMLPKVFELFAQVIQDAEVQHKGLGIGLALARQLVELHGGTITAHSDGVGYGAEFVVTFPVEKSSGLQR